MARMFFIALLLAAVPARAASFADAGPDSTGPPPNFLVRELNRIQPASRARVETSTLGLLEGTLERWDVHSLLLREPTEEREIPLSSVQGLWVRGRATGHGAKVGAITLGILGAAAGPLFLAWGCGVSGGGCNDDGLAGRYVGAAVVGAVAGGAIGALVGAGVGAAFPRWNRHFP